MPGEPDGVAALAAAHVERGAWYEALDFPYEGSVRGATPYLRALTVAVVPCLLAPEAIAMPLRRGSRIGGDQVVVQGACRGPSGARCGPEVASLSVEARRLFGVRRHHMTGAVRVSIVPDTKDWTWVLESPCPDCEFDAAQVAAHDVGAALRDNAAAWQQILTVRPGVRDRPRADVWSPLEYACHVRDVCRLFDERTRLMLDTDDPTFTNWDQGRDRARRPVRRTGSATGGGRADRGRTTDGQHPRRGARAAVAPHRPSQRRQPIHRRLVEPLLPARRRPSSP